MTNVDGVWDVIVRSPMGEQKSVLTLKSAGAAVRGTSAAQGGQLEILDGKLSGNTLTWRMELKQPFAVTLLFAVVVSDHEMAGTVTAGALGKAPVTGARRV
jgi:hypothetical protein